METATIIYYSSNREKPDFEARIIEHLKKSAGDLPIVSVTQYPIDLGKNICVGDVGVSGFNMFRQVQIACQEATTDFVISAEADCMYPPDYFLYEPNRDSNHTSLDVCYRNSNLYVMPDARDYFFYKGEGATHAQVVGRKYYLEILNNLFTKAPKWTIEEKNFPKERWGKQDVFDKIEYYQTDNPCFQVKTHKGMRYFTHSDRTPIYSLPYWGDGKVIRQHLFHGGSYETR